MTVVKLEREEANLVEGTVREYLEPYFTDQCPHVARLRDENKPISDSYVHDMRTRMEKYIFPDQLCKVAFADVKRADILDFRSEDPCLPQSPGAEAALVPALSQHDLTRWRIRRREDTSVTWLGRREGSGRIYQLEGDGLLEAAGDC